MLKPDSIKSNKLKLEVLLNEFMTDLTKCKTLVAHNMKSGLSALNNELLRCDMINKIVMNAFLHNGTNQNIV